MTLPPSFPRLPHLHWYPKPNGAGDIDGTGSQRLLGQPELDLANLVVRETAQNSWDARLPGHVPSYGIRIRTLDARQTGILRTNVVTQTAPTSRLSYLLSKSSMDVLEITDRNTSGLGGALRNDVEVDGPHDWADFVLTIGAPPDKTAGGGTYGFGKTASYVASSCATILIWSVVSEAGVLQHRFIASAMDGGFAVDRQRFTGRQWWGRVIEEGGRPPRVEPVVGVEAQLLGEALFERHFAPGETGTSLMILAPWPPVTDEDAASWPGYLPGVVVRNLWPKLIPDQPSDRAMKVEVVDHGRPLALPTTSSATFNALARTMQAVRSPEGSHSADPMMRLVEIRSQRPKRLIGHLALTRHVRQSDDPLAALSGRVSMMRSPELIVRAQDFPGNQDESLAWVGIFKPLDGLDRIFASAEPPAHDVWEPQSVRDKPAKSIVTIALRQVKDQVREFLTPVKVDSGAERGVSTAAISGALAGLAGTALGSRPSPAAARPPRRSAGGRPQSQENTVTISRITPLPLEQEDLDSGRERARVHFSVAGRAFPATVEVSRLAVAAEGQTIPDATEVHVHRWEDGSTGGACEVPQVNDSWFDVVHTAGLAFDVAMRVRG